ncbi:hypothetical protein TNCV_2262511 [Trichonephila clavipes]|nr:hypothetical protein TNCV_2262511 [Trichonephila clavipes]
MGGGDYFRSLFHCYGKLDNFLIHCRDQKSFTSKNNSDCLAINRGIECAQADQCWEEKLGENSEKDFEEIVTFMIKCLVPEEEN